MKTKNKTNYGERFVEAMTKCFKSGMYDAYIQKEKIAYVDHKKIYKYVFYKPNHIADWLTAIDETDLDGVVYSAEHPVLEGCKISGDVAWALFWAMDEAYEREQKRNAVINKKRIKAFLEDIDSTKITG